MIRLIYLHIIIIVLVLISSCNKNEITSLHSSNEFIVHYSEAKEVAKKFFENNKNGLSLRSDWQGKSRTFNGANTLPGLHVFNSVNGIDKSFVIISGDKRIAPILAFGYNEFPIDSVPFGIAEWLSEQITFIDSIRTTNLIQTNAIANTWLGKIFPNLNESGCCQDCPNYPECLDNPLIGCGANSDILCDGITNENPCGNNNYFQYGPLLDTRWGQNCVYNELCPEEPIIYWPSNDPACGGNLPCGHYYTGCVATSMAQIINYFERPANYDYPSLLPIYHSTDFGELGAEIVAQIMIDAANSVDMDWGCYGSGAYSEDIDNAFENDFGYSYGGDLINYGSSELIKQNIDLLKPVIFTGCSDGISLFNWIYDDCHAWVCDGYMGFSNNCYVYLYYSMNWGWNGRYNGWYGVSNWAPGSYNFQYDKEVLLNITP